MEWTGDTTTGEWIRDGIDDPWHGTIHDVVPRGFEAYARILHPASVQSLPGDEPMPSFEQWHTMPWEQAQAVVGRIEHEPATWADAASAFGTTVHPLVQWDALVRSPEVGSPQSAAPDGRWFDAPAQGGLDSETFAALVPLLAARTASPDDGGAGLWEGSGGLVGFMGHGPSRTFFQVGDADDPTLARHNAMLGASVRDRFNSVFRKPSWQEGILSREVSERARLPLPGRSYVVFRGGIAEFTDPEWALRMPWRDRIAEGHGFAPSARVPGLLWPGDRAWVMVSEVDYDSTIVGGSRALIDEITATAGIEAWLLPDDAALTSDADRING